LLRHGARPRRANRLSGSFPLLLAAEQGHFAAVDLLLRGGADPEQKHARSGEKAVEAAEAAGHAETVDRLRRGRVLPVLLPQPGAERAEAQRAAERGKASWAPLGGLLGVCVTPPRVEAETA